MNLTLLLILPLVFSLLLLVVKGQKQVRLVALVAAVVQLGAGLFLLMQFLTERATINAAFK